MISPFIGLAQEPNIIPPSPEAASVFKFTEMPVSLYTGVANTSIPLYDINVDNIDIPITLNYHGRGMGVEEMAPRVGIGWSLDYGGMISRQIRGLGDDATIFGYLHENFYNDVFTNASVNNSVYNYYMDNMIDLVPDLYFLDMAGNSGKFMFDQTDKGIMLQNYSDIKIHYIEKENRIKGWTVTDNKGNKYYYGLSKNQQDSAVDYDNNVYNYSYSYIAGAVTTLGTDQDRFINTWHLMEIETPDHDSIKFVYEREEPVFYRRQYDKNDGTAGAISYFAKVYNYQYQIKEITFKSGKIKFTRSNTPRKDLSGAYALGKVEIFDKNDVLIKRYDFHYEYPHTVQDNNQLTYLKTIDTTSNHRLFLASIQEEGQDGDSIPPYIFEYDTTALPNRFSNSQDEWGYYNGKPNGPYLTFFNYGSYSVNRNVDTIKSQTGLLKKITYPSGGSVSFTYEQNRAVLPSSLYNELYSPNHHLETVQILDGFLKNATYYHDGIYSEDITIGPTITGSATFSFDLPWSDGETTGPLFGYKVHLLKDGYDAFLFPPAGDRTLALSPGTYTLEVIPPIGHDPSDYRNTFVAQLRWEEVRDVTDGTSGSDTLLLAGGSRIKKMVYNFADGHTKTKEYTYTDPSTGTSSGKVFGLPNLGMAQKPIELNGNPIPYTSYTSFPGAPLRSQQGNSIGYAYVTEYDGSIEDNTGKTEYKFTTTPDAGDYDKFPFPLPADNEWLRGKVLDSKIYADTTNGYVLRKEVENKYSYAGHPDVDGIYSTPLLPMGQRYVYEKDRTHWYLPLIVFDKDTLALYSYYVYYQMGGTMDLYTSIETDYDESGSSVQKQTNYYYNYNHHYQTVRNAGVNSKGDSLITDFYYPPDIANPTAVEQALIDSNRISTPLKVETIVKSHTSGAELSRATHVTKFKSWGNNIIAPELLQTSYNSAPLDTETRFFSYDAYGNPTEAAAKNGIHIAYLWGYGGQYPVAKVSGSDYNTVKGFINQTMLDNAFSYTDEQIRTELNKIRIGLAGQSAQVTTYTYSPLLGMTSETDPSGKTTYYEYDSFGRLKLIRDEDGKILKQYDYQYQAANNQ